MALALSSFLFINSGHFLGTHVTECIWSVQSARTECKQTNQSQCGKRSRSSQSYCERRGLCEWGEERNWRFVSGVAAQRLVFGLRYGINPPLVSASVCVWLCVCVTLCVCVRLRERELGGWTMRAVPLAVLLCGVLMMAEAARSRKEWSGGSGGLRRAASGVYHSLSSVFGEDNIKALYKVHNTLRHCTLRAVGPPRYTHTHPGVPQYWYRHRKYRNTDTGSTTVPTPGVPWYRNRKYRYTEARCTMIPAPKIPRYRYQHQVYCDTDTGSITVPDLQ